MRTAEAKGLCIEEAAAPQGRTVLHVSASTRAVRDDGGALRYFVMTKKDVTPLKVMRDAKLVEAKHPTCSSTRRMRS